MIWVTVATHSLISSTPDSFSLSFSSWTLYGIMPFFIITPKAVSGDFWTKSSDRLCSLSDGLLCSVRSSCQRLRTVWFILLLELSPSSILTWLFEDEEWKAWFVLAESSDISKAALSLSVLVSSRQNVTSTGLAWECSKRRYPTYALNPVIQGQCSILIH